MEELNDKSKMPFGRYRGKPLGDVPASYFHYLWSNGLKNESSPLADYITRNLEALKMEHKDGIW